MAASHHGIAFELHRRAASARVDPFPGALSWMIASAMEWQLLIERTGSDRVGINPNALTL
jgi:hypothetical protein